MLGHGSMGQDDVLSHPRMLAHLIRMRVTVMCVGVVQIKHPKGKILSTPLTVVDTCTHSISVLFIMSVYVCLV